MSKFVEVILVLHSAQIIWGTDRGKDLLLSEAVLAVASFLRYLLDVSAVWIETFAIIKY